MEYCDSLDDAGGEFSLGELRLTTARPPKRIDPTVPLTTYGQLVVNGPSRHDWPHYMPASNQCSTGGHSSPVMVRHQQLRH